MKYDAISYASSAAAVVFGIYISAQASFRLDKKILIKIKNDTVKDIKLYKDSVIEVTIFINDENESIMSIALKYLKPPENLRGKGGKDVIIYNSMGGETDWFILPYTFGAAIGKKLFEQYNAGLDGFDQNGIEVLKSWLIDMEIINNAMCY